MEGRADIGTALAEAAKAMHGSRSIEEALDAIVHSAAISVPGFDHVGVTAVQDGSLGTRAASSDLVHELDRLQFDLGEGPCVDAVIEDRVVSMAPHARHDQRWPRYMPQAVRLGLRSQMGVKLHLKDRGTIGGLNLYSTLSDDIDPDAEPLAELFATHAAIALGSAGEISGLNQALESRKVIGQALGILMERYDLTEEAAFAFLSRASNHSNTKVREVARRIVEDRSDPKGLLPPA